MMALAVFSAQSAVIKSVAPQKEPFIVVDTDLLDYGVGYNGYSVYRTLHVQGFGLTDDITLKLSGSDAVDFVLCSPSTISPEQAAEGYDVVTRFFPLVDQRYCNATLTLSSPGAAEVTVRLKGFGIKTSSRIAVDVNELSFECALGAAVTQDITVTDTYFSGWLAASSLPIEDPDIIIINPTSWLSATVEGDASFSVRMISSHFPSSTVNEAVFRITYFPLSEGDHTARLVINGYKTPPTYIELTGHAVEGDSVDRRAPILLAACDDDITSTTLRMSWLELNPVGTVSGYVAECSTDDSFDPTVGGYQCRMVRANKHSTVMRHLSPGETYYCRVKCAFVDGTFSEWSNVNTVTLPLGRPCIVGDANGDGNLSLADVVLLLGSLVNNDMANVNAVNADVNEDDDLSLGDIAALIDLLLTAN